MNFLKKKLTTTEGSLTMLRAFSIVTFLILVLIIWTFETPKKETIASEDTILSTAEFHTLRDSIKNRLENYEPKTKEEVIQEENGNNQVVVDFETEKFITTDYLNNRSSAVINDDNIIQVFEPNTILEVIGRDGEWVLLKDSTFVHSDYIVKYEDPDVPERELASDPVSYGSVTE